MRTIFNLLVPVVLGIYIITRFYESINQHQTKEAMLHAALLLAVAGIIGYRIYQFRKNKVD
jgi:chromate transport protein ChrA